VGGGVRTPRRFALAILITLLTASAGESIGAERSPTLSGTVIKVTDGDTITVQLDSGPIKVRVFGADAPEREASFGAPATKLMRSLVEGKPVEVEPVTQDSYGRMVASVFVADTDVGSAMIERGYAWAYRRYLGEVKGAARYCDLEAQARAGRRGLWAGAPDTWEPPWVMRARQRGEPVPKRDYAAETAADCRAAIRRGTPDAGGQSRLKPLPKGGARCRIKGNINSKGERWFCTEEEARAAGWRAPS
jgi:endonuclease YncB( thermonuclease family)